MNYNTSVMLWINELELMRREEAAPLLVCDGHIFRTRDERSAIARFSSTEDAISTLKQAGFAREDYLVRS